GAGRSGLVSATQAELIAILHRHITPEHDFHHFLAVNLPALFVLQRGDDLLRLGVHDLARRRVGAPAAEAESHPAWLLTQLDARHLFGRHYCGIEDMNT